MSNTLSIVIDCEELGGVDGDGLGEGEVAFEGEELLWEEDDVPHAPRKIPSKGRTSNFPGLLASWFCKDQDMAGKEPESVANVERVARCIGSLVLKEWLHSTRGNGVD